MGEEDPYSQAVTGKLKLKNEGIKKKKKRRDKKALEEMAKLTDKNQVQEVQPHSQSKRTKAEIAFQKQKEKMQTQKILEKASMTHKERVEKFNQHLDSLTEHFDIPKVSWTK